HKHWRDQLDASEIGRWALHEQWTHYAGFFRALSFKDGCNIRASIHRLNDRAFGKMEDVLKDVCEVAVVGRESTLHVGHRIMAVVEAIAVRIRLVRIEQQMFFDNVG